MMAKRNTGSKRIALCEAAVSLLQLGKDRNSIKVAEIAALAGIGKGTVYDYFQSKDELIACSVRYYMEMQYEKLEKAVFRQSNLKDMIYIIMKWLDECLGDGSLVLRILKIEPRFCERNPSLQEVLGKENHNFGMRNGHILQFLMEQAAQEYGFNLEGKEYYVRSAIFGPLHNYVYIQLEKPSLGVGIPKDAKDFTYLCINKLLEIQKQEG